jgi:hypothetical protein
MFSWVRSAVNQSCFLFSYTSLDCTTSPTPYLRRPPSGAPTASPTHPHPGTSTLLLQVSSCIYYLAVFRNRPDPNTVLWSSVADPDPNPDPSDPYVFEPPRSGSGSISQRYGSGSGYRSPSKKSKKNLDSYCLVTSFWLFIFENDVQVPS